MNEKDVLKLMKNDDYMSSVVKLLDNKNAYIINSKPVYGLRECLENIDDLIVEVTYKHYKYVKSSNKNLKKNPSRSEMINILEKEIKETFMEFLSFSTFSEIEFIDSFSKNKNVGLPDINLIIDGYVFIFEEKEKITYIVPNEILDLYKEYVSSDKKKENDLERAERNLMFYVLINGILPIDFIEDLLINEYHYNVSKQDIKEIALKQKLEILKNKYYALGFANDDVDNPYENLLKEKENFSYLKVSEEEILDYYEFFYFILDEFIKIMKNQDEAFNLYTNCVVIYREIDHIIDDVKLSKKQKEELTNFLEEYYNLFRIWSLNGRTADNVERDYLLESIPFKEKPSYTDLDSCLKNLPKDNKEILFSAYEVNDINLLKEKIKEEAELVTQEICIVINEVINGNNEELTNIVPTGYIKYGLVYLYKENDKVKYFIPEDILDILKNNNQSMNSLEGIEALFSSYVTMNGIIEKEKLQELLKEYHNMEFTIEELDEYAKEHDFYILNDKYYSDIEFDNEDIENFVISKEIIREYKKVDFLRGTEEANFINKLDSILTKEISLGLKSDSIFDELISVIKLGKFSSSFLDIIFEDFGISSNNKLKEKIKNLYNEYKDYISIWIYNGYSISEYNDMIKNINKKVGRNELCPCGSGKKYKKCCGK